MAPPRAQSLLAAAVTVAVACRLSTATADNCGLPGCTFTGDCETSSSVTCDMKNEQIREINLTRSIQTNLPTSLRVITVSHATRFELRENVVDHLSRLEFVQFTDIGTLVIGSNSMAWGYRQRRISITIQRVENLIFSPESFSGWRNNLSEISIREIGACSISSYSFGSTSRIHSVTLENIANLTTERRAFQGDITNLSLRNVVMETCREGTFGGRIGHLSLTSVRLNNMSSGCVDGDRLWRRLTVRSSVLGSIATFGVQGTIQLVLIEDSHIAIIHDAGFELSVSSLSVNACVIGELKEDALEVVAHNSISLQRSLVNTLQKDALHRLRTDGGVKSRTTISKLFVNHVDNRTIFVDGDRISVTDHILRAPFAPGEQRRVRELGSGVNSLQTNLTYADRQMYFQLIRRSQCEVEPSTPTLAAFRSRCCPNDGVNTTRRSCAEESQLLALGGGRLRSTSGASAGEEQSGHTPLWWPYVVAIAALQVLLLAAVLMLVLVIRRRRAVPPADHRVATIDPARPEQKRQYTQPANVLPAAEEPEYCQVEPSAETSPPETDSVIYAEIPDVPAVRNAGTPSRQPTPAISSPLYDYAYGHWGHSEQPETGAGSATWDNVTRELPVYENATPGMPLYANMCAGTNEPYYDDIEL